MRSACSMGREGDEIAASRPESVIATLDSPVGPAVLHDGTMREDTRQSLLMLIEQNATLAMSTTRTAAFADIPAIDVVAQSAAQADKAPSSLDIDPSTAVLPVAPVPINAQPGEAAAPPRSSAPAPSAAQRMQPRESPSAGNPVPSGGRLDAHASSLWPHENDTLSLPRSTRP